MACLLSRRLALTVIHQSMNKYAISDGEWFGSECREIGTCTHHQGVASPDVTWPETQPSTLSMGPVYHHVKPSLLVLRACRTSTLHPCIPAPHAWLLPTRGQAPPAPRCRPKSRKHRTSKSHLTRRISPSRHPPVQRLQQPKVRQSQRLQAAVQRLRRAQPPQLVAHARRDQHKVSHPRHPVPVLRITTTSQRPPTPILHSQQ